MLFWESLCPSVSQLQGTKHVPGSLGQRNLIDQNMAGFANMCGFPLVFQYHGAVSLYADHNAQLFPHLTLAQALIRHVLPDAADQN
jgi:hypothetical protein